MSEKKVLTRDDILKADDVVIEEFNAPEWGGIVYLRVLPGTQRDSFEGSIVRPDGTQNLDDIRAKLLTRCFCDADGRRIFTDKDVRELGRKSGMVLDRAFQRAKRLNGFSDKDIEQMAGNSSGGLGGDSTSA